MAIGVVLHSSTATPATFDGAARETGGLLSNILSPDDKKYIQGLWDLFMSYDDKTGAPATPVDPAKVRYIELTAQCDIPNPNRRARGTTPTVKAQGQLKVGTDWMEYDAVSAQDRKRIAVGAMQIAERFGLVSPPGTSPIELRLVDQVPDTTPGARTGAMKAADTDFNFEMAVLVTEFSKRLGRPMTFAQCDLLDGTDPKSVSGLSVKDVLAKYKPIVDDIEKELSGPVAAGRPTGPTGIPNNKFDKRLTL